MLASLAQGIHCPSWQQNTSFFEDINFFVLLLKFLLRLRQWRSQGPGARAFSGMQATHPDDQVEKENPKVARPKTVFQDAFFIFHFIDRKTAMHNFFFINKTGRNTHKNNAIDRN